MKTKKITFYSLMLSLALVLSYLESLVPLSFAVPGIKMGLPNIVIVFVLYKKGFVPAVCISIVRVLLVSILFGNVMSMFYSMAGAVLSMAVMGLLKKSSKFSCVGVSVAGALGHNAGQIAMAALLLKTTGLVYYFPVLCAAGVVAGVCIGILGGMLVKRADIK